MDNNYKNTKTFSYWLFLSLSLLTVLSCFSNNISVSKADKKADESFKDAVKEYAGDNLLDKVLNLDEYRNNKQDTITSVLGYLLIPGSYMNDISRASIKDDLDNTVFAENGDQKSLCDVSKTQPQNLLNHNCDLPSLATSVGQKVASTFSYYGIVNGESTTAKSNWGVPSNLPNDKVPNNPDERTSKYTGLELFGYNLQFVNYTGEWDDIQVSTEARLLSNYGFLDRVKLGVSSIWNGAKAGFTAVIEKFDWNPIKYATNIINETASSIFWTSIDTSDYNVAATHAWTRPEFANTLYNVYYMNTKDISEKAKAEYNKQIKQLLQETLGNHPSVKDLFDVDYANEDYPRFVYDENKTRRVPQYDDTGNLMTDENGQVIYTEEKIPESEQLAEWRNAPNVQEFFGKAANAGVSTCSETTSGVELKNCYENSYNSRIKAVIQEYESNGNKYDIEKLAKQIENLFKKKNIYLNPATGISHYVCGTEEGKPLTDVLENYQYVYMRENTKTQEYLNPSCKPVRPSVKGGFYGSGDTRLPNDTRWEQFYYVKQNRIKMGLGGSLFHGIAQIVTKLTVTILDFSYGNILEVLEIDKLVETMIVSFRDTIFYPLTILAFSLGGLMVFLNIFKQGSVVNSFKALVMMFLVFAFGIIVLSKPGQIIKLVDEVPNKIDRAIISFMVNNPTLAEDPLCSSDDPVRTLECKIWKINIFNPWILGQWGTTYENLNANNLTNRNRDLVGDAEVNMGGGTIVNNWAVYQLDKTKAGTITDDTERSNVTSRALYKIVDLQFGPNNGQNSDSRYAKQWSGLGGRSIYRIGSAFTSIAIAIPIVAMSIAKLEMNFLFAIMLMWLPIQLLIGILPKSRQKLIGYGQALLGIFVKRMVITMLLSFSIYFITVALETSTDYWAVLMGSIGLGVATMLYWKDLVNLFNVTAENGNQVISSGIGSIKENLRSSKILPASLEMRANTITRGARDFAVGTAVGGAAGVIQSIKDASSGHRRTVRSADGKKEYRTNAILEGMLDGGADGIKRATQFAFFKQRREGFGLYDTLLQAKKAGEDTIKDKFRLSGKPEKETFENVHQIISNKVEVLEENRMKQMHNFHQDYNKLIDMAIERKIPLNEDGTFDFESIMSRLFDENGEPNKNFKDGRFDNALLRQITKVNNSYSRMVEAKSAHVYYKLAEDYLNQIKNNDFNIDDKELYNVLKELPYRNKEIKKDENGNAVKDPVTNEVVYIYKNLETLSDELVDRINGLKAYNNLDDKKSKSVSEFIRQVNHEILSVRDDYVDEVWYRKEKNTAEFIKDVLEEKLGDEPEEALDESQENLNKELSSQAEVKEYLFDTTKVVTERAEKKLDTLKDKVDSRTVVNSRDLINKVDSTNLMNKFNISKEELFEIQNQAVQEANKITNNIIDTMKEQEKLTVNPITGNVVLASQKVLNDVNVNMFDKEAILGSSVNDKLGSNSSPLDKFNNDDREKVFNNDRFGNPNNSPEPNPSVVVPEPVNNKGTTNNAQKVINDVKENLLDKENVVNSSMNDKLDTNSSPLDKIKDNTKVVEEQETKQPIINDVKEEKAPTTNAQKVLNDVKENLLDKEDVLNSSLEDKLGTNATPLDKIKDNKPKEEDEPTKEIKPEEKPTPTSEKVLNDVRENVIDKEEKQSKKLPDLEPEKEETPLEEKPIERENDETSNKEEKSEETPKEQNKTEEEPSKENNKSEEAQSRLSEKEKMIEAYRQEVIKELLEEDKENLPFNIEIENEETDKKKKQSKRRRPRKKLTSKAIVTSVLNKVFNPNNEEDNKKNLTNNNPKKKETYRDKLNRMSPDRLNNKRASGIQTEYDRRTKFLEKQQAGLNALVKGIEALQQVTNDKKTFNEVNQRNNKKEK